MDIDHLNNLHRRIRGKGLAVALESRIEIGLSGHGKGDEVSFSVSLSDSYARAQLTGAQVVGPNIKESLASRCIRIYGDHRDTCLDGSINFGRHELRICRRDKNTGRV